MKAPLKKQNNGKMKVFFFQKKKKNGKRSQSNKQQQKQQQAHQQKEVGCTHGEENSMTTMRKGGFFFLQPLCCERLLRVNEQDMRFQSAQSSRECNLRRGARSVVENNIERDGDRIIKGALIFEKKKTKKKRTHIHTWQLIIMENWVFPQPDGPTIWCVLITKKKNEKRPFVKQSTTRTRGSRFLSIAIKQATQQRVYPFVWVNKHTQHTLSLFSLSLSLSLSRLQIKKNKRPSKTKGGKNKQNIDLHSLL